MTFASPLALLLLIPWGVAAWRILRRAKRRGVAFAPLARLPLHISPRQRLAWISPLLFLAGLAAGIVAAARPQERNAQSKRSVEAIAINMVVDISGSMVALDLSERKGSGWDYKTRLDVVKEVFREFVDRRPDDLIGLVAFGGFATTRSPLTFDHNALLHVLETVKIPGSDGEVVEAGETATAIGDGLTMACARLRDATNVLSRVVVLLSDGESNFGIVTPEEAAELAHSMGIKVYTIGVGTTGNAPVRGRDMFGREVITRAWVSMDDKALRDIAEKTGGMYFGVEDRTGLQRAIEEIDRLEKTVVNEIVYEDRRELFGAWLGSGVGLVFLGIFLAMLLERRLV